MSTTLTSPCPPKIIVTRGPSPTGAMSSPTLPLDIILLILDHVHHIQDIRSFQLVCKCISNNSLHLRYRLAKDKNDKAMVKIFDIPRAWKLNVVKPLLEERHLCLSSDDIKRWATTSYAIFSDCLKLDLREDFSWLEHQDFNAGPSNSAGSDAELKKVIEDTADLGFTLPASFVKLFSTPSIRAQIRTFEYQLGVVQMCRVKTKYHSTTRKRSGMLVKFAGRASDDDAFALYVDVQGHHCVLKVPMNPDGALPQSQTSHGLPFEHYATSFESAMALRYFQCPPGLDDEKYESTT